MKTKTKIYSAVIENGRAVFKLPMKGIKIVNLPEKLHEKHGKTAYEFEDTQIPTIHPETVIDHHCPLKEGDRVTVEYEKWKSIPDAVDITVVNYPVKKKVKIVSISIDPDTFEYIITAEL